MARKLRIVNTDENPITLDPATGLPTEDKPMRDAFGARWVESGQEAPRETLSSFAERYDREQQEKRDAPVNAARAENEKLWRELKVLQDAKLKKFYSRPSLDIVNDQTILTDGFVVLARRGGTPRDLAGERAAAQDWAQGLDALGYSLNHSGKTRVACYVGAQAEADADATLPLCWITCMERLRELDVFGDELKLTANYREPVQAPAPVAPEPEVDLDSIPDTREGRARAKEILEGKYFGVEAAAVWARWTAHLLQQYQFCPTTAQERKAVEWFQIANKSFLNEAAYDACRRAMVRQGICPSTMLTPDERLAQELENQDVSDYDSKREFILASRRVNG